jgi:hypothetical protein
MSNNTINEIKQVLINNLNSDDCCRCNCIEILNRYMNIGPYDDDTLHEILRDRYKNSLMLFVDAYSYREEQYYSYGYDEDADYINMNNCTLYSYSDLMDVYLYLLGGTREHEEYEIYSETRIHLFAAEILCAIGLSMNSNLDDILLAINEEYGLIIL